MRLFFELLGAATAGVLVTVTFAVIFGIAYAAWRARLDLRHAERLVGQPRLTCERCEVQLVAYAGARFCGAACSAKWEAGE